MVEEGPKYPEMQVVVAKNFAENRGDHAAEVSTFHTYDPSETVEDLVARVMEFPLNRFHGGEDPTVTITLGVVKGTAPVEQVVEVRPGQ